MMRVDGAAVVVADIVVDHLFQFTADIFDAR